MQFLNTTMTVQLNAEVLGRSRMLPNELVNARQELIFHRLLSIEARHGTNIYKFAAEDAVMDPSL